MNLVAIASADSRLGGNWTVVFYHPDGDGEKVADNIAGVWVKILREGKVIANTRNRHEARNEMYLDRK